jgi:hypothetical protein
MINRLMDNRNRGSTGNPPAGSLSLDLDNKWAYLKTRGDDRWWSLLS